MFGALAGGEHGVDRMTGESGFDVQPGSVNGATDSAGIGWVSAEVVDFGLKFGRKLGVGVGVF